MHKCLICGKEFNPFNRGRKKQYCTPSCRDYSKYKNAIEKILVNLDPTPEAKKVIKGDMFRLANLLPNGTKSLNSKKRSFKCLKKIKK